MVQEKLDLFLMGYEEMKRRLEPEMILCNGRIPDEIAGEVWPMEKGYTVRMGEKKMQSKK